MAACGVKDIQNTEKCDQCEKCLEVVRSTKTVRIPVRYNRYEHYTVKVPRQVSEQIPRTVYYTDYETRQRPVSYKGNRSERRTRTETKKYQVPVRRCYTEMQTKEKQVAVPYYVDVPETRMRTITYQVPVEKTKTEMETVMKTVYDKKVKFGCVPEERICSKEIPVYNVVAKAYAPCPAEDLVDDFNGVDKVRDGKLSYNEMAFDAPDKNKDGQLSFDEYHSARASGNLGNTSAKVSVVKDGGNGSVRADSTGNGKSKHEIEPMSYRVISEEVSGYLNDTTVKMVW